MKQEDNGPIDHIAVRVSEAKIDLTFEISILEYPGIHGNFAFSSLLSGLRGHGGLKIVPEAGFSLKIQLSNHNSLCSYVFLDSECFHQLNETEDKSLQETSVYATRKLVKIELLPILVS